FTAHDPQTYTKIIDLYARIMATQLGLPPHYLGYTTDNPASAEKTESSLRWATKDVWPREREQATPAQLEPLDVRLEQAAKKA
ncbi:hypothetical protein KBZ21_39845, partial [Streptomyces sp. A73]|nr:hypothetical protein [Streptomyces sp. A73]